MNTEQKHTPEPWVLHGLHINVGDCYIVGKGAGAAEHMRRIIACVNACAECPTDVLQKSAYGLVVFNLMFQRDELAEVVRALLAGRETMDGRLLVDENSPLIDAARAALAKVQS